MGFRSNAPHKHRQIYAQELVTAPLNSFNPQFLRRTGSPVKPLCSVAGFREYGHTGHAEHPKHGMPRRQPTSSSQPWRVSAQAPVRIVTAATSRSHCGTSSMLAYTALARGIIRFPAATHHL